MKKTLANTAILNSIGNTPPVTQRHQQSAEARVFELLQNHPRLRVRETARPHCQRWIEEWRSFSVEAGAGEAADETRGERHTVAFFEFLGLRPAMKSWHFEQAVKAV